MAAASPVRVRFAPSPTGYLHVGGARTALFNWLYARHAGGTFILRIEDTDFERSTQEMVEGILVGMRWLGLDWDEGPFFQSQRMDLYRATAKRLVESGHAYYCFCKKEPAGAPPDSEGAEGAPPLAGFAKGGDFLKKDRDPCRALPRDEAVRRCGSGEAAAVRFLVPEFGSTRFDDAVFGPIEIAHSEIEDFVLLRSDGVPTYHLSVVADDIDMRITHVIRGADHVSNTPKQIMLYEALGAALPVFAHLPLILGPDKTRLSKRHGATSVIAYKDEGFLPEAFRNYLALLGWSPPDSTKEIMSDQELISLFLLEGISKSNAVFDRTKLEWMNAEYIRALPVEQLTERLLPIVRAAGYDVDAVKMQRITPLIRERIKLLKDVLTAADFFFVEELPPYETALLIPQKGDLAMAKKALERAREVLAHADFNHQALDQALRTAAKEMGLKPGQMFQPIRVAVTGRTASPPLFETLEVLGRETAVKRMGEAVEKIQRAMDESLRLLGRKAMQSDKDSAPVRPDQRWTITLLNFDELKHDESFCSIVALARAVNALHFVHTALIDNQADTPAGMRNRFNSLLFACALFAEASLLVASMQKYFRGDPAFQKLAAATNSKEARDLLKDSLFPVRNKLVFHFDLDEVRRQMEELDLPNPILMTAMGTMKLHTYYELADLVALRTLFGPVVPGKSDQIRPVLQSVGDVILSFLVAAENFMVDVLNERGWAVRDTLD